MYEVSSEIYKETDFQSKKCENGRVLSTFGFIYPPSKDDSSMKIDDDGDLIVTRKTRAIIEIEHSSSTVLQLVGLQVWRGALLLADYLFHIRHELQDKQILELGAGVGLTSIAAAIYAKKVICTDVDIGGILELTRANVKRNGQILKGDLDVMELDFKKPFSSKLTKAITETDIVIAADVIYDDDLTDCLINVLGTILVKNPKITIYMALEQRYVFTLADLDSVAPCYEYFKRKATDKHWIIRDMCIDFPQYFEYERCKELLLLKITN